MNRSGLQKKVLNVRDAHGTHRQTYYVREQDPKNLTFHLRQGQRIKTTSESVHPENNVSVHYGLIFAKNANNGTDHAWGSHHLVLGGAVAGGVYGTFPTHELRGPDDAGDRGDWIPTTGLDQYAATLARWFDVPEANLNLVFPNLANFSPQTLGFV